MTASLSNRLRKIEATLQPQRRWFTAEIGYGDDDAIERETERLRRDKGFRDGIDELIVAWRWTRESLAAARTNLEAASEW